MRSLFILFLIASCHETSRSHIALGTWNFCDKDGDYAEYIITNEFFLLMTAKRKKFLLLKNEIIDNSLVISNIKGEVKLIMAPDTLVAVENSENKIVLKSHHYPTPPIQLSKVEFDFDPIDWGNLDSWKSKIKAEFNERAELKKCPDLRSDEEKIILKITLDSLNIWGEEVPMTPYPME